MSNDNIADITNCIEALELEQEAELTALLNKHRKAKRKLLCTLQKKLPKTPPRTSVDDHSGAVLSASCHKLHQGDTVIIQTTASIGCKGDIAKVLFVSTN